MPSIRAFLVATAIAASLSACHGREGGPGRSGGDRPAGIVYSPNGEPLTGGPLGTAKCEDALAAWFTRLAGSREATLPRDSYLADARTQFAKMDLHHAGYVTSTDLSEYRAPFEPPQRPEAEHEQEPEQPGSRRRPGNPPSANRDPTVDTRADPVMSADKTLSFKVTLDDFIVHANETFSALDTDRDERLSVTEVTAQCRTKAQ
jgi:hypothetical protein